MNILKRAFVLLIGAVIYIVLSTAYVDHQRVTALWTLETARAYGLSAQLQLPTATPSATPGATRGRN